MLLIFLEVMLKGLSTIKMPYQKLLYNRFTCDIDRTSSMVGLTYILNKDMPL